MIDTRFKTKAIAFLSKTTRANLKLISGEVRRRYFLVSLARSKRYHCRRRSSEPRGRTLYNSVIKRKTRASDRVSIAFTGTTVSHRAPSILRHALQTIYGKSIPQRGGQTIMPCLSQENPAQPGRIIPSRKNPTSRRAILLRGDKGAPLRRYENLAKIKNRRLPRPPSPPPVPSSRNYRGAEPEGERVERRICVRARRAAGTVAGGRRVGKVGYDMSGMLYDPIFQEITFRAFVPPDDSLLFRFSPALCSIAALVPSSFLISLYLSLSSSLSFP